ncbi:MULTISPECIES: inositol monophosphatase family protein [unclassified Coleofasciculus]|uniref:inositol monophosphatase family protein n=1 Tax=unclassified Coleofasciculus TaxID=2692782 RepID=UPI00187E7C96|nr:MULTISPECIES: inositol monophosphatase family protein [unclassified Coleofasciculus]MBE9125587.1 inositol monophosphatase family protein [Coleofasciculus sp. LEGE 07081]MBE9147301.1 inositol monophosphatase family protein [Coleofasciculus sp. LEGE 07092]
MNEFWTDILNFAKETTNRVGTQLLPDFRRVQAFQKADGSLVTKADHWADDTLREAIASRFPSHGILSEEGEHQFPDTEWCWIIDPLDGTTNFTRGIPIWGISLGLLYHGTPVFGYVHFPPIAQSFHGFWGGESGLSEVPTAAFMNEFLIHSSPDELSSNHFFNLCSRSTSLLQQPFPCKMRMLGVASYNFITVATGAVLGGIEATPKIWDIAGAWVIVLAAGGVWVPLESEAIFPLKVGDDYSKRSFPTLVASRDELVNVFKSHIQSSQFNPILDCYSNCQDG